MMEFIDDDSINPVDAVLAADLRRSRVELN